MIYCMAGVHGMYDKFCQMLEKIKFSDNDELYILGNMIDCGPNSMELLFDITYRDNVFPIVGVHEYTAYDILSRILENPDGGNPSPDLMKSMVAWRELGGEETMKAFVGLSQDDKEEVLDYLGSFSLYEEVEVSGNKYLLLHAGIDNFSPERELESYKATELTFSEPDFSKKYFDDKTIITGHTPTFLIDTKSKGKILRGDNIISIDCGVQFGEPLACLCLDTMEEFYVY